MMIQTSQLLVLSFDLELTSLNRLSLEQLQEVQIISIYSKEDAEFI